METARKFQSEFNRLPTDYARSANGDTFVDQRELDELMYRMAEVCTASIGSREAGVSVPLEHFEFDDGSGLTVFHTGQTSHPARALVDGPGLGEMVPYCGLPGQEG